ncbi:hypothetical protein ILUMI_08268 [Ignelater luminosus]|uniref:Uncharacterized protein n=1 Tax=Ignelater luminosus TaxID=2038154 RepID=A0A8K0D7X0_IGNLU|nr:hypothetical protein ILUMI_08268 [Ignelater luminosus]
MDEPTSSRQADQKQWREKFLTEVLQSENKKSSHYNDEEDLKKVIEEDCNVNLTEDSDDNVEEVSNQDEVCSSENEIQKARKTAAENLVKQAKKMKATSDKSHPPANIGDNVTIPIPDVDKGKGDLRNIIGVILQTNDEGFYKVGTKHGVLEKLYCRYLDKRMYTERKETTNNQFGIQVDNYKLDVVISCTGTIESNLHVRRY